MEVVDTTAYRDAGEGLRSERDELIAQRGRERNAMPATVIDVYARRFARVVTGLVGVSLAVLVALLVLAGVDTALVIPAAFVALIVTRYAARSWGRASVRRRLDVDFGAGADVRADVDRLLRDTPFAVVRRMADAHEPWSVVLSAMSTAIWIPLAAGSAFHWLLVWSGWAPRMPQEVWQRAFLPHCLGVLVPLGIMLAIYSRNVRLETVHQLMKVYRGSIGEAWFTAGLVGAMCGLVAGGSMFLRVRPPFNEEDYVSNIFASDWFGFSAGELVSFFVIWGGMALWLVMKAIAPPVFAILHRRVEAERITLGLSADDFLRREP